MCMRLHIHLDDELVAKVDEHAGPRGRSGFIANAVARAIDDVRRLELLESAFGSIADGGHEWDDDPAAWVAEQRRQDPRRVG